MSNNKSRFLSILIALVAILAPIAVHAQDSYLFASVNGNAQNLGGAVFQYTPPGAQTTFAPGLSRPRVWRSIKAICTSRRTLWIP